MLVLALMIDDDWWWLMMTTNISWCDGSLVTSCTTPSSCVRVYVWSDVGSWLGHNKTTNFLIRILPLVVLFRKRTATFIHGKASGAWLPPTTRHDIREVEQAIAPQSYKIWSCRFPYPKRSLCVSKTCASDRTYNWWYVCTCCGVGSSTCGNCRGDPNTVCRATSDRGSHGRPHHQ